MRTDGALPSTSTPAPAPKSRLNRMLHSNLVLLYLSTVPGMIWNLLFAHFHVSIPDAWAAFAASIQLLWYLPFMLVLALRALRMLSPTPRWALHCSVAGLLIVAFDLAAALLTPLLDALLHQPPLPTTVTDSMGILGFVCAGLTLLSAGVRAWAPLMEAIQNDWDETP